MSAISLLIELPLDIKHRIIEYVSNEVEEQEVLPEFYSIREQDDYRRAKARYRQKGISAGTKSLIALSSTCSFFRDLLAGRIFQIVLLRNSKSSALSVRALGLSRHRQHVKQILYAGCALSAKRKGNEELGYAVYKGTPGEFQEEVNSLFPLEVKDALENLVSLFPALRHLSIEFPFDYEDLENWEEMYDGPLECNEDEEDAPWKLLVCRSWAAICKNEPNLEALSLVNFQCISVPSFGSELNPILQHLKEFSINFLGWRDGAGWSLNTRPAFSEAARNLAADFLVHLDQCETLKLYFAQECPVGDAEARNHAHEQVLEIHHLPKLRHLDVAWLFMDQKYTDFLVSHTSTLETIKMRECICSADVYEWADLFQELAEAPWQKLQNFDMASTGHAQLWNQYDEDKPEDNHDEEEIARIRQKQEEGKRIFPYVMLDDKYGMLFTECDTNRECLLRGDDERSYNSFMSKLV